MMLSSRLEENVVHLLICLKRGFSHLRRAPIQIMRTTEGAARLRQRVRGPLNSRLLIGRENEKLLCDWRIDRQ